MSKGRVLVAMSGGVDSSVTALLLSRQGYECVGATMRLHEEAAPGKQPTCGGRDESDDARCVAEQLGIPFHVLDYRDAFRTQVVERFVDEYAHGRTPNPCILCNRYLKFGLLFQKADELGCEFVATGHYAQVARDRDGLFWLQCGADPKKDQSYVLYALGQLQLSRLLLPLGSMDKDEVRRLARESGLPVAAKQESQDICFIPDGDYASFLKRQGVVGSPGPFIDQEGRVVGEHQGIERYTIGQRKGLGLSLGQPVYVTHIDAAANTVTVGPREALELAEFLVNDVLWASGRAPEGPLEAEVRTHYHAARVPVRIWPGSAQEAGECPVAALNTARVEVLGKLRGVAPGQAAVFYQDERVLGGGTIIDSLS